MLRLVLALLVCAVAYPVALLIGKEPAAAGGALFVGAFTVLGTLAVGVPLLAWCIRRNWVAFWHALLGGAAIGASVSLPLGLFGGMLGVLHFGLFFAAIGAAHAGLFWLLGVWRNPEVPRLAVRLQERTRGESSAA